LNCHSSSSLKLDVKYFKNSDRHDVVINKSEIGNHQWAIDWQHDL